MVSSVAYNMDCTYFDLEEKRFSEYSAQTRIDDL